MLWIERTLIDHNIRDGICVAAVHMVAYIGKLNLRSSYKWKVQGSPIILKKITVRSQFFANV